MKVLVEGTQDRLMHRRGWFNAQASAGTPVVVDRRTARLIAATPCPDCFPEAYT